MADYLAKSGNHAGPGLDMGLLFMLSTGIAPEKTFPEWLRPFVRNQPVSQVAETLRGFATGHVKVANLATSLAWCVGMVLVFGAITLRLQRRT